MLTLIKVAIVALDIIAISDVLSKYRDFGTRFLLIVMILVLPIIGAGLYLLVFRPKD
jgi:hypothetical protein